MQQHTEAEGKHLPHIFLVIGGLQAGGAERVISQMANYWVNKNFTVTMSTWSTAQQEDFYTLDPRVERIWLDTSSSGSSNQLGQLFHLIVRVRRLRSLLKQRQPCSVLSFITNSNVMTLLATLGLKNKVVVSERVAPDADNSVTGFWSLLRKVTYRFADAIVIQSRYSEAWVRRLFRKAPVVIANPMRDLPEIDVPREKLIVAVGRLAPQKGFDLLLQAFKKIESVYPDWRVVILGAGAELKNLEQLRDQLGLQQRVHFAGQVRNVEDWMARAGLVVQPSRFEGFPNVVLESMGMGAAVISSDCPSGPADIICDGVNGRLVPVEDIDALAQAMKELIARPDLRESLGKEARKISQVYNQERIMVQWNECLFGDSHAD